MVTNGVKLKANTIEDLNVVSSLLQDSLVHLGDMKYLKKESEFLMVVNRFCWEKERDDINASDSQQEKRCICGLKIGYVKQVSYRGHSAELNQFYNLLTITYEDADSNENELNNLTFTFSTGYDIRLTVDELALVMQDIAAPHPGLARPQHDLS